MLSDYMDEEDQEWKAKAECDLVTPIDVFFESRHEQIAKQICKHCEVRESCLSYAIRLDIKFGIWGGMTARERRRFMKR